VDNTAYVIRMYLCLVEVATKHSQISTHHGYAVVTRRTMNSSPYHTIETASSKPHLEAMGPGFTSPSGRIFTFLPCRSCIVTKSKLQKVNPYYVTTYQYCYSPYTGIKAYLHRRFLKIWSSVSYYTRMALIPAVTSHPYATMVSPNQYPYELSTPKH
jgi:hypothetical protein